MIRKVRSEDIEACAETIRASFLTVAEEFGFTPENAPRFTAFAVTSERLRLQLDEGRPMFLYEGKRILGYYSLHPLGDGMCELNNLCVLPAYRHQGLGEALFRHAVQTARELGCRTVKIGIVEENWVLRRWYEGLGAVHVRTEKFDFFPFTCGYLELKL